MKVRERANRQASHDRRVMLEFCLEIWQSISYN